MIQRWRANIASFENNMYPIMESDDNGMWIGYNDHIAIVNKLKQKHQQELEEQADYYKKETVDAI